ncbi:coat protein [Burkholderia cepacia]|uniref:major capsid protein n=1 Tax=Burkholderia cepacia TaxID=292 RepID=UPI0007541750|nr:major capsid protein [Burkholderia cepacia]KVE77395.1 coat protein [Burkholderia cepacia]
MKKHTKLLVVGSALAALAGSAMADTSGIDTSAIVPAITGITTTIAAVGGAILSVVVVAWGYRIVKGFMGR